MFEGLNEKFDMTTEITTTTEAFPVVVVDSHDTLDEDVAIARANIRRALETAQDAVTDLANIAKTAESPRAFEVLGQFIKTISDTSKDLVELQQKKQDARKRQAKVDGVNEKGGVVNNNVFVGSTTDLLRLLKKNQVAIQEASDV